MNNTSQETGLYVADFLQRLYSLDQKDISFAGYSKEYLSYLIKYKEHYVSIYQQIIEIVLKNAESQLSDIVFVDFGTGNGLLAMFARLLPFHRVVAIDLDKEFVAAAGETANLLSIDGIEFIHGGEDCLTQFETDGKKVVIVGTDVIEHIYDLTVFFKSLIKIPNLILTIFTTASNPANPSIVKSLMTLQRKEELTGGDSADRALFGYAHKSFLELRKEIISDLRPSMEVKLIDQLAKLSRGLKKDDIEKLLLVYEKNGVLPKEISHPTNTCHPYTGSWSERLIDLEDYEKLYDSNGLKFIVINGFYDSHKGGFLRRVVIRLLNYAMGIIPASGRKVAPFIFLIGVKKR